MHDPHRMNGHPSLQPPSVYDILYRIEGRLGGVETGLRMSHRTTLQAIEKAFDRISDLQDRVSRLEASGQEPKEQPDSRLKCIREALPDIREIIIMILLIAAGLGLPWAPPLTEMTTVLKTGSSSD